MRVFAATAALALTTLGWVVLVACLALGVGGCTAPLARPAASVDAYCESLDRDHRTWGALGKFSGVLAGSGALATLPIDSDEKTTRASVAISAAAIGAFAAAAIYVEQDAASTYSQRCHDQ